MHQFIREDDRCIYNIDKDVLDVQTLNIEYESGALASFVLNFHAMGPRAERNFHAVGTRQGGSGETYTMPRYTSTATGQARKRSSTVRETAPAMAAATNHTPMSLLR